MSNTEVVPGAVEGGAPGGPMGEPQAPSTPGQLAVAPLSVYLLAYVGLTQVRIGSNGPFQFTAYRADGGAVNMPTIKSCVIIAPNGGDPIEADKNNPSDPTDDTLPIVKAGAEAGAIQLPVYILYALAQTGVYKIRLQLQWGDVVASTPQEISITCSL